LTAEEKWSGNLRPIATDAVPMARRRLATLPGAYVLLGSKTSVKSDCSNEAKRQAAVKRRLQRSDGPSVAPGCSKGFSMSNHAHEIADRRRFEFGKNWQYFLGSLDDSRILEAERSLKSMLGVADLKGASFLDIGSGSGLFSLAARRLGARVHSFDYDPECVACTRELKDRFYPDDPLWNIEEGSVLDRAYLTSLGKFDIVYAWGVLHHTGAMWQALENVTIGVAEGGRLFVAIYNTQRYWSRLNRWLKHAYVASPAVGKWIIAGGTITCQIIKGFIKDAATLRNPLARYRQYHEVRGMSWWNDCFDWIGGYPYETATPNQIFDIFHARGFVLERLDACGGHACNQFVFRKALDAWPSTNQRYTLSVTPVIEPADNTANTRAELPKGQLRQEASSDS
jgi:2-polyprenyl-3-methyl-5-hydroxy-6-metoxy-1,4-benzoquinol methylase